MQALDATDGVEMCLWLPRHSPFDGGYYAQQQENKSHPNFQKIELKRGLF